MIKKIVIIIFLLSAICTHGQAQKCPFNEHNCPGKCGLFTDNNSDGYCDFSTQAVADTITAESPKKKDTVLSHTTSVKKNNTIKNQNFSVIIKDTVIQDTTERIVNSKENEATTTEIKKPFHLYPVLIAVIGMYLFSFIFVKTRCIKRITHRKIWNILLTISFLVTGITGLIIAFYVHYAYIPTYYMQLLTFHYDFGLAMTIISIFHALWHLNYYKTVLKKNKK